MLVVFGGCRGWGGWRRWAVGSSGKGGGDSGGDGSGRVTKRTDDIEHGVTERMRGGNARIVCEV
jgi:hypothetical protein